VPRDSTVWDCAAGNGQASIGLAGCFARVIATDASREQIGAAPAHPRIEYRVAAAERSGLPDHSVALVTVAQALHWFDFDRFYAEVRRVLQSGGVLAVWTYGVNLVEGDGVDALVQRFYRDVVGAFWPPERRWVEEKYRTIPFPFAEIPVPGISMEVQWTLAQLLGYFGTWSATNRCLAATGKNPLAELGTELARVWGPPDRTHRVCWPLSMRVGRVNHASTG
jgi:SAM-dependent methyltransferase